MKTKTIGTLLIAGLVVLSAMVVFATPVMADEDPVPEQDPEGPVDDPIRFNGTIQNADGTADANRMVAIQKYSYLFSKWWTVDTDKTDINGFYETNYIWTWTWGTYRMVLKYGPGDWRVVDEKVLVQSDFEFDGYGWCLIPYWTYIWNYQIPEFATIALPALSVLGLFLYFNRRKQRKE